MAFVDGQEVKQGNKFVLGGGTIGLIIVVVGLAAFVFQNTQEVRVNWMFLHMTFPLWIVIVITIVATLIAERFFMMIIRHRRRKERRS